MSASSISASGLADLWKAGKRVDLIDVRSPIEYRELHVVGARNIPLDELDPMTLMQARIGSRQETVYVICRSGGRGKQACEKFLAAGYANVANVEGGTLACEQAGLPVVRGEVISLERQVRIALGSLVLIGAVLGWLLHPVFIGLSVFVGAGMIFAGVTDTCGMGLLLARMPWNRRKETAQWTCSRRSESSQGSSGLLV